MAETSHPGLFQDSLPRASKSSELENMLSAIYNSNYGLGCIPESRTSGSFGSYISSCTRTSC